MIRKSSKGVIFSQLFSKTAHLLADEFLGAADVLMPSHLLHLPFIVEGQPVQDHGGPDMKGITDLGIDTL